MTKKTLGSPDRASTLLKSVQNRDSLAIEEVVVTTADQIAAQEPERRTAHLQSKVTPSEKEAFLDSIGRVSESSAIRELILIALGKPTNNRKDRETILKLINKNNGK